MDSSVGFAGRLTPIGLHAFIHVRGMSEGATNPDGDDVKWDLEVTVLEGILREKLWPMGVEFENLDEDLKPFRVAWDEQQRLLAALQVESTRQPSVMQEAKRLAIRAEQFAVLYSAAVRCGLFDTLDMAEDDWAAEASK